mgnify:CR=1 FL=1
MKISRYGFICFMAIFSSGCVMYPQYYSTGNITGRVVVEPSNKPISNSLVIAELAVYESCAVGSFSSEPIKYGYGITDTNGIFSIPPLRTFYFRYESMFSSRYVYGRLKAVCHPAFGNAEQDRSHTCFMERKNNSAGLQQISPYFPPHKKGVSIRKADKSKIRSIIQELHNNASSTIQENRLYDQLMQQCPME